MNTFRTALSLSVLLVAAAPAPAQEESLRYRTGEIKVGDRVMANAVSNGAGEPCTVTGIRDAQGWRPGYDGDILVRCDSGSTLTLPATGDHVKRLAAGAAPAPAGSQASTATAPTPVRPPAVPVAAVPPPTAPALATPQTATAAAPMTPAPLPGANAFGTRDPQPCPRVTSKPSTAEAARLAACFREAQGGKSSEYITQDVRVTTMSGSKYDPRVQTGFTNMDTTVDPIAITGSLVAWSCRPVDPPSVMAKYSNVGANCDRQVERNASGYCYRTRAGTWTCSMNDTAIAQADKQYGLAPPR